MWPTFFIPRVISLVPNTDCFWLYTKTADETRNAASGRSMDSDLVFPTEPNSTYWVTGHVQAKIINATGDPGVTYTVLHTGDSLALASRTQLGSAFVAPTNTSTGIELTPFDLTRIGTYPWPRATPVVNQILSMFPDFTIVTGATGGECGIGWGLYDLGAAGSTALLAGSFLYVRRLGV